MNQILVLFLAAIVSSTLVLMGKLNIKKFIQPLLSFSAAFLLGVSFLHLLPEAFASSYTSTGTFILIGFFLQLSLDYFSGGIEHGHIHVDPSKVGKKFPWLIVFSLCLHAFLEATPLLHLHHSPHDAHSPFLLGLLLHKIPIAIVLSALLIGYQIKKSIGFFTILIFASMAPLGALLGSELKNHEEYLNPMIALSVGIILHLSTTILIETNEEHSVSLKKILPMLLGAGLSLLSVLLH